MQPMLFRSALLSLLLVAHVSAALPPDQLAFFESKIRPVLARNCYECHSAQASERKKLKAGLFADTRAGLLRGGETGSALDRKSVV